MIFLKHLPCYWCDDRFYTEIDRTYHLCSEHPEFFERYDEVNGWNPFSEVIPNPPEGGDSE